MRRKSSSSQIAKIAGVSSSRGIEAVMKAQLISAILDVVLKDKITHAEIAKRTKIPRSAVTGILSGSLQKVTLDRVLKILEAVGLTAEVRVKRAA
jgi:predicted XRE-type DNA-binding protein